MVSVLLEILDGIRGSTCTEGALHTQCRWAMAHACTAIDVVRADHRTNEFLHEVVLLVRTTRGTDPRDTGIRAVVVLQLCELVKR